MGPHDNFLDLGGHSLHLARVHNLLESDLGRVFSMVDLFCHPTVASLAAFLENPGRSLADQGRGTDPCGPPPVGPQPVSVPLTAPLRRRPPPEAGW
ncbi:acyl carrier protein [Streptomyces sp. SM13]|uniref:acyl carrier protein n=1 Tax=Streptomyces sp. SM13 TaxID=1983803 RepID=UPI0035BC567D